MEHTGTLKVLANALKLKNDPHAVDENGRQIRILKLWTGGMMRGVLGASASAVLQKAGLGNVAVAHGAVSAGGPTALAQALKIAHLTASMYEGLEDKRIITIERGRLVFDLDKLIQELGPIFDEPAIKRMREDVYVVVTNPETGEPKLLNVKNSIPDSRAAIAASMAVPNFYSPVEVNGFKWCDGAWADLKHALGGLIKKFHPTDVMVFVNGPKYPDWTEQAGMLWGNMWSRPLSPALQFRSLHMDADLENALDWLMQLPVRSYIVRPKGTDGFYPWTTHPRILRLKADEMKSYMEGQLEDACQLI